MSQWTRFAALWCYPALQSAIASDKFGEVVELDLLTSNGTCLRLRMQSSKSVQCTHSSSESVSSGGPSITPDRTRVLACSSPLSSLDCVLCPEDCAEYLYSTPSPPPCHCLISMYANVLCSRSSMLALVLHFCSPVPATNCYSPLLSVWTQRERERVSNEDQESSSQEMTHTCHPFSYSFS